MEQTAPIKRPADLWQRLRQDPTPLLLALAFAVGFAVRLFGIGSFVWGVNADEASTGYDAWAIANYGMDRNLVQMPAYLIAWGSGQSAGYAYLLIPFIKVLGLNLFSLRLPMALAGCASLWALYTILRRSNNKVLPLLGVFLLAICPWHIVKSRWALEANLFPEMLLWGIALLCAGLANGKKRWFYLGFGVLGLSAWAYAMSFVVLPLFLVPVALVLWRKKHLSLPHLAGCFGVLLLCSWPVVLFSLSNLFNWGAISTPFFTIPRLVQSRGNEFALFGENPLGQMLANAKNTLAILLAQDDGQSWSVVQGYGLIYLFSLPLAVAGFLRSVLPAAKGGKYRQLVPGGWLFLPLLAVALVLAVMIEPNVNRINVLWFPLVWYWVLGAYDLVSLGVFWRRLLAGLYAVYFILFCNTYMKVQADRFNDAFDAGFLQAVRHVDALEVPVYVSGASPPYIKVLFEVKTPPEEFRQSITREDVGAFGNVLQWGKWTVSEPESAAPSEEYAIIVRHGKEGPYLEAGWQLERFGYFWAGAAKADATG